MKIILWLCEIHVNIIIKNIYIYIILINYFLRYVLKCLAGKWKKGIKIIKKKISRLLSYLNRKKKKSGV